jgi:hypothetical protein
MKMGKTRSPVEIDWKVSGSKIVFEIHGGKKSFAMDAERFGLLLNGDYVRGQVQAASEEKLYPAEWGIEKFVEAQRLLKKLLNLDQIAGLWGAPEASVRAFYSEALQKYQHAQDAVQAEQKRQDLSKTEKDYCLSLRRGDTRSSEEPRAGEDFLEVPLLATFLKENGIGGTAEKLQLDVADLQEWVEKNKRYLALFGYKDNLF